MYDARQELCVENSTLQEHIGELEEKLVDEAKMRIELQKRLDREAEARQEVRACGMATA